MHRSKNLLFDHLVGQCEERRRHVDTDRARRLDTVNHRRPDRDSRRWLLVFRYVVGWMSLASRRQRGYPPERFVNANGRTFHGL
jgi:hypothetical protein